jgi:cytochrome c-type biogenesis protein
MTVTSKSAVTDKEMFMAQMIQDTASVGLVKRSVQQTTTGRFSVFFHAVAFVFGFALVFTVMGSAIGLLGRSLNGAMPTLQRLGAILLAILGLTTLGFFRWLADLISQKANLRTNPAAAALVNVCEFFNTLLYTERRVAGMHTVNRNFGYMSSVLLGMSFAAGWTPCIGPILGGILTMAGQSATATQGALLLAIYSLGLGIPFLLAGIALGSATSLLRQLNRYLNIVSIVSGIFLLIVAYLLWSSELTRLAARFLFLTDIAIDLEDWVGRISGTGGMIDGLSLLGAAPLAFIGGLISFISPCVLPLVPAYLGFLSGAAVAKSSMTEVEGE